jgi:ABC-type Fe3+-hydroxamate transport system, periplasmic component
MNQNSKRRTHKTRRTTLFSLLILVLLAAACSDGAQQNAESAADNDTNNQPEERVLKDFIGNEVKVPAHPERIIASYLEDHLVALGVKPVAQWSVADGKTVQDYLQYSLQDVPTIPSELPYEAVMSFRPDLILLDGADMASGDKYAQYSKIAPTYIVGTEEVNDWRKKLLMIGEVLNKSEEARKALEEYERKASEAREKLNEAIGSKSAAAIWLLGKDAYIVHENRSSGEVLYHDLGMKVPDVVKEISASATANWLPLPNEKLAELDADYLFIVKSEGTTKDQIVSDPIWSAIPAVRNGHIYEFGADSSWLYSGTIANGQIIDHVLDSILK